MRSLTVMVLLFSVAWPMPSQNQEELNFGIESDINDGVRNEKIRQFDEYQVKFRREYKALLGDKKVDPRTSGVILVLLLKRNQKGEHWVAINRVKTKIIVLEKFVFLEDPKLLDRKAKEGAKKALDALMPKQRASASGGLSPPGVYFFLKVYLNSYINLFS